MNIVSIDMFDDLVDQKLAIRRRDDSLVTYKYHNKVFYNNLWHTNDNLLECRGIVFDSSDESVVNRPFKKIFNQGEKGVPRLSENDRYTLHHKVNGFMAAASWHKGKLIVSTTGTTTSDYAKLARSWIEHNTTLVNKIKYMESLTFIFECCDPSDPHIVYEKPGLYLLGIRHKEHGFHISLSTVAILAEEAGVNFPGTIENLSKEEMLDLVDKEMGEGFVVYRNESSTPLLKMKSPYYLSRKALARLSKNKMRVIEQSPEEFKQQLDEEFYDLFDTIIRNGLESFYSMTEQERLSYMDSYFRGELANA